MEKRIRRRSRRPLLLAIAPLFLVGWTTAQRPLLAGPNADDNVVVRILPSAQVSIRLTDTVESLTGPGAARAVPCQL